MPSENHEVQVTASLAGSALVLSLRGDMDLDTARAAGDALLAAVAELSTPGVVVLDLTGLELLAAIGVGILRGFADHCAERGIRTHLVSDPDTPVYRVVEVLGLGHVIPSYSTLPQALASPPGPGFGH
jgi:anti-anti-sigma factor